MAGDVTCCALGKGFSLGNLKGSSHSAVKIQPSGAVKQAKDDAEMLLQMNSRMPHVSWLRCGSRSPMQRRDFGTILYQCLRRSFTGNENPSYLLSLAGWFVGPKAPTCLPSYYHSPRLGPTTHSGLGPALQRSAPACFLPSPEPTRRRVKPASWNEYATLQRRLPRSSPPIIPNLDKAMLTRANFFELDILAVVLPPDWTTATAGRVPKLLEDLREYLTQPTTQRLPI